MKLWMSQVDQRNELRNYLELASLAADESIEDNTNYFNNGKYVGGVWEKKEWQKD